MEKYSDKQVIWSIKNGQIDDFHKIINRYNQRIHNFVAKKIYNQDDVEDIVQEIFLSFYRAIGRFKEKKPVLPYLFEIAKNQMKMYFRSRKSTLPLKEDLIVVEDKKETLPKHEIEMLLNCLSLQQRKALLLVSEGYSYQEIARRLNKPINNIRTLIHRARLKVNKLASYDQF